MEFKEFCKQFARMDKSLTSNPFKDATDSEYIEDWLVWSIENPQDAENFMKQWVKENPEPVYPTFGDYLLDMASHNKETKHIPLTELLNYHIPDTIAKQYQIAPLNLCDIDKYTSEWR